MQGRYGVWVLVGYFARVGLVVVGDEQRGGAERGVQRGPGPVIHQGPSQAELSQKVKLT